MKCVPPLNIKRRAGRGMMSTHINRLVTVLHAYVLMGLVGLVTDEALVSCSDSQVETLVLQCPKLTFPDVNVRLGQRVAGKTLLGMPHVSHSSAGDKRYHGLLRTSYRA